MKFILFLTFLLSIVNSQLFDSMVPQTLPSSPQYAPPSFAIPQNTFVVPQELISPGFLSSNTQEDAPQRFLQSMTNTQESISNDPVIMNSLLSQAQNLIQQSKNDDNVLYNDNNFVNVDTSRIVENNVNLNEEGNFANLTVNHLKINNSIQIGTIGFANKSITVSNDDKINIGNYSINFGEIVDVLKLYGRIAGLCGKNLEKCNFKEKINEVENIKVKEINKSQSRLKFKQRNDKNIENTRFVQVNNNKKNKIMKTKQAEDFSDLDLQNTIDLDSQGKEKEVQESAAKVMQDEENLQNYDNNQD